PASPTWLLGLQWVRSGSLILGLDTNFATEDEVHVADTPGASCTRTIGLRGPIPTCIFVFAARQHDARWLDDLFFDGDPSM
ncbi:MAG: hypothetical protein WCS65_03755, partial [Verrucomicrobiae bacterium]